MSVLQSMKRVVCRVACCGWCIAVAAIPVVLYRFGARLRHAIGCAPAGDCYLPGAEELFHLHLIVLASALLLWPACAWFAVRCLRSGGRSGDSYWPILLAGLATILGAVELTGVEQ